MSSADRIVPEPSTSGSVGGADAVGQSYTDGVSTGVSVIARELGLRFRDPSLLETALRHASLTDSRAESNERMEFLGDAVLGLVVCEQIYRRYPTLLEGDMTKIKSSVVSRHTCAAIARQLGIEKHVQLGKGMLGGGGASALPHSLAAAALEAIIAAIYLDGGFAAAERFLIPIVGPLIDRCYSGGHQENFKSILQQHAQRAFAESPSYLVLDEKGPDHAKCFEICVEIGARRFRSCWGQSKKQAEQQAAFNALEELGVASRDPATGEIHLVRGN